jgi:glutaredoxin
MVGDSIPPCLVEVYSKPGCSLCSQTLAVVESVRQRIPFELLERDVRQDAELRERWRYDIPVVCIDGEVAFRGQLTPEAFEERLREAASSRVPERGETGPASPE